MSKTLEQFEANWLARLNRGARTRFEHALMHGEPGLYSAVADEFVTSFGLKGIGFNWELLDASPKASGPRSALTQMIEAVANDISNPNHAWLGENEASKCARDFLSAFDRARLTVVSNRYDGLWNPIAGTGVEWGFVAFDDDHIALLLLTDT